MPKIIENLEYRLLEEAIKQIHELGYGAVTIRSVANACGVGVGTVYNYFPSKDDLLAAYLLQDWNRRIEVIQNCSADAQEPLDVIRLIYEELRSFARKYEAIFKDPAAKAGFSPIYTRQHRILRGQLSEPIRKFCDGDFCADFIAEAMLTWTLAGKGFDEIYAMVEKLF